MSKRDHKLFAGPRLRLLRRSLGLTQSVMARELEISASYLNLIEANQRPLTAQFLLKLAETYDTDLRSLSRANDAEIFTTLNEVFSDPLLRPFAVPKAELQEIATVSPAGAEAVAKLYATFRDYRERMLASTSDETLRNAALAGQEYRIPVDDVHDFLHASNNYFDVLDKAAEKLSQAIGLDGTNAYLQLVNYLKEKHGIEVAITPRETMMGALRFKDRHHSRLMISELLLAPGKQFQVAYQVVAEEFRGLIDEVLADSSVLGENSLSLARIALTNYMAGALLMPYVAFLEFVQKARYDIEAAASRFETSFEQVCHRFTTLQRPRAKGIPFYMIRVDNAGNISKRFSNTGFPISRFGGSCPLWNIHNTFQTAGKIVVQVVETPDDRKYLSVARTIERSHTSWGNPPLQRAISVGCGLEHADKLVYSRGLDLANPLPTPIGTNCSLCERPDCQQRAHPPLTRQMIVDETRRNASAFSFSDRE